MMYIPEEKELVFHGVRKGDKISIHDIMGRAFSAIPVPDQVRQPCLMAAGFILQLTPMKSGKSS